MGGDALSGFVLYGPCRYWGVAVLDFPWQELFQSFFALPGSLLLRHGGLHSVGLRGQLHIRMHGVAQLF
jgi:hypothetical protein